MAKLALFVLVMLGVAGLSPRNSQAEMPGSYVVLKGGIYSPSATFDLGNVDVETTFDGDTETGVAGEIAFGHHVLPTLSDRTSPQGGLRCHPAPPLRQGPHAHGAGRAVR
jgi:hypothetical protein